MHSPHQIHLSPAGRHARQEGQPASRAAGPAAHGVIGAAARMQPQDSAPPLLQLTHLRAFWPIKPICAAFYCTTPSDSVFVRCFQNSCIRAPTAVAIFSAASSHTRHAADKPALALCTHISISCTHRTRTLGSDPPSTGACEQRSYKTNLDPQVCRTVDDCSHSQLHHRSCAALSRVMLTDSTGDTLVWTQTAARQLEK